MWSLWVKVKVLVAQLCSTLCDPMDCSLPGVSVHGIFQARIQEWVAMSFFRESSQSRDWTWVSWIAGRLLWSLGTQQCQAPLALTLGDLGASSSGGAHKSQGLIFQGDAAAAAKSRQSCSTLCDHIDGSPPGSTDPGILQAKVLEWVAIAFSNAWKWSCSVVPDSLQPHGLQPTRLLRPWDFPGKSTGVGCHCLLQGDTEG